MKARVADRDAAVLKPAGVAELGEDGDRGQLPDAIVRDQRVAAGLPARVRAQLLVDRRELGVERVDHRDRDHDLLACGLGQRLSGKPFAPVANHQLTPVWTAVVVEHGLDPLLPLAALVGERMPRPDPRAQIEDVLGRDPRLRQPVDHQQLAQMPGIRAAGHRALLFALAGTGLRRLSQVHLRADSAKLLDHEPPPRRRLQRNFELLTREPSRNRLTPVRSAGITRARDTSPVGVSIHSAVICARC
jgi:hypothetical protein